MSNTYCHHGINYPISPQKGARYGFDKKKKQRYVTCLDMPL